MGDRLIAAFAKRHQRGDCAERDVVGVEELDRAAHGITQHLGSKVLEGAEHLLLEGRRARRATRRHRSKSRVTAWATRRPGWWRRTRCPCRRTSECVCP